MKKIFILNLLIISFLSISLFFRMAPAEAKIYSLLELIENSQLYNGKTITCEGEVIGDIMVRKEGTWINLDDNGIVMGIFIPKEVFDSEVNIKYTGGYKAEGDILQIYGVFNRTCPEHNEEMDIHAIRVSGIKQGHLLNLAINIKMVLITIIACLLLAILVYVYCRPLFIRKRKNERGIK
jgi:hypothetical protein